MAKAAMIGAPMLPEGGRERLREQLQAVRRLDEKELAVGIPPTLALAQ
jgi:hypothetical protein